MNMANVKVNWNNRIQMLTECVLAFIIGFLITSIILWWVR
jgi:hypothetical protein